MSLSYHFAPLQGRLLHLGVCGSVAAFKAVELMRMLQRLGFAVGVTLTDAAMQFVTPLTFESLGAEPVYSRMFGQDSGTSFAHLMPGAEADVMLIAPTTATTIARLAAGLADDLLAAQVLAFTRPVIMAPAMNPRMWQNAATRQNIRTLTDRGIICVTPESGTVACGDMGEGKLASLDSICLAVLQAVAPQDMQGKTVMLTIGPTREQWDGVRYWTNPSTGKMGAALAVAAWLRGAQVHAVCGQGVDLLPAGIVRHDVTSAREMYDAASSLWPDADYGIFTAAVADFSPEPLGARKFKKSEAREGFSIRFVPNPDILAELGASKRSHQKIIGFAAETEDLAARVADKLHRKNADMLVGNLIGTPGAGFGSSTNTVFVQDKSGTVANWESLPKTDIAWRLLTWLLTL